MWQLWFLAQGRRRLRLPDLTLQWGVMSPTMLSAMSCTSAIFMQRVISTPQQPLASSDINPILYIWSGSTTGSDKTQDMSSIGTFQG
jgi:hypothetical protein